MKVEHSLPPHVAQVINTLSQQCHEASADAGWWNADPAVGDVGASAEAQRMWRAMITPTKLCLIHSEISEAMEGFRQSVVDDHLPDRSMFEVELADALIRIFDLAGAHSLDLGGALLEKFQYNQYREDHKQATREAEGGKKF